MRDMIFTALDSFPKYKQSRKKTVLQGIMGKDDIEDGHNVPEHVRLMEGIDRDF